MLEFLDGRCFDLPDPLTGNTQDQPYLLECHWEAPATPEATIDTVKIATALQQACHNTVGGIVLVDMDS
jgi:hypothetical protein